MKLTTFTATLRLPDGSTIARNMYSTIRRNERMNFPKYLFIIDEVYEFVDYSNLEGTQAGYIGPNGDTYYIDEEEI